MWPDAVITRPGIRTEGGKISGLDGEVRERSRARAEDRVVLGFAEKGRFCRQTGELSRPERGDATAYGGFSSFKNEVREALA